MDRYYKRNKVFKISISISKCEKKKVWHLRISKVLEPVGGFLSVGHFTRLRNVLKIFGICSMLDVGSRSLII